MVWHEDARRHRYNDGHSDCLALQASVISGTPNHQTAPAKSIPFQHAAVTLVYAAINPSSAISMTKCKSGLVTEQNPVPPGTPPAHCTLASLWRLGIIWPFKGDACTDGIVIFPQTVTVRLNRFSIPSPVKSVNVHQRNKTVRSRGRSTRLLSAIKFP